jgi:cyclic beta-1,2-glucan synthetase
MDPGVSRATSAQHVVTETCDKTGALLARNPWNASFAARTAFFDLAGEQTQTTCDRREFIGLDGALDAPIALRSGMPLSGRSGAGLDPCAALLTEFELAPGAQRQLLCFLGQAEDRSSVVTDIQAARNLHVEQVFAEIKAAGNRCLARYR